MIVRRALGLRSIHRRQYPRNHPEESIPTGHFGPVGRQPRRLPCVIYGDTMR